MARAVRAVSAQALVLLAVFVLGVLLIYHKKCPAPSATLPSVVTTSSTALPAADPAATAVPACDGTCFGPGPVIGTNRYVSDDLTQKYIEDYKSLPFRGDGMGTRDSSWATTMLSSFQRQFNVSGCAGEIGVHHGYFFMSVALTARVGEKLFALDLFERQQAHNVDASGSGNRDIFTHNFKTLGIPESAVEVVEGLSSSLTPGQLCTKMGSGFRFLSIDGGHTKDILINDMLFAECCLVDGGIAALDDYSNAFWPGVHDGIVSYFDRHGKTSRLAPFLLHANKLYVTTVSHHARYLSAVTSLPFWGDACTSTEGGAGICIEAPGVNGGNAAKFSLGGHHLAVAEFRDFDPAKAMSMWQERIAMC